MILMMLITLFTSRVILESLGVQDYGIYNAVGGFVAMFSILRAGLVTATQRFITYDLGKGDMAELTKTFSTSIIIYLILSAIIIFIAEIGGVWFIENKMTIPPDRSTATEWTFQLSLVMLVIGMISSPYNALIIAHEKMSAFAYISVYEAIAKLVISYLIFVSIYDKLIVYACLLCLVQLSVRLIYSSYCHRHFSESKFHFVFDIKKIKQIYSFTGWSMFGGIAHLGFTQGLNMLLNVFFNPTVNAARGIAVQVQGAITHFVTNFQTAVNPQIIKSYSRGDKEYMFRLICASSKYSYYLLFILTLPIYLETDTILSLWLKEVPQYSSIFFRLIIITTFIDTISNPIMRSVDATGKIRNYQLIVGGILISIVPISYIVLRYGGAPYSVFIVHIIMGIIALGARLFLAKKIVGFPIKNYIFNVLFKIFKVTVPSIIIPVVLYVYIDTCYYRLICICFTSWVMTSIMIYFLGLEDNERITVKNKVNFILSKFQKRWLK